MVRIQVALLLTQSEYSAKKTALTPEACRKTLLMLMALAILISAPRLSKKPGQSQ
jgi:hypothetical protein